MKAQISHIVSRFAVLAALVATPVHGQTINSNEGANPYAKVRGWTVYSMSDDRGIFSCRAVRGKGYDKQIMIEYNGFDEIWRVLVQGVRPSGDGPGIKGTAVYYDGRLLDRQVYFGNSDGASNSHAKLDLSDWELGRFKTGNKIRIKINGERSRTWSLKGSTAAVLKVAACTKDFGFAASTSSSKPPTQPAHQNTTATVDGNSIGYVVYPGGELRATGGGEWAEEKNNGAVFYFKEYERNSESVFLNDASRNLQIWISLPKFEISFTENFNKNNWKLLYSIDCFDREASRAC